MQLREQGLSHQKVVLKLDPKESTDVCSRYARFSCFFRYKCERTNNPKYKIESGILFLINPHCDHNKNMEYGSRGCRSLHLQYGLTATKRNLDIHFYTGQSPITK